MHAMAAVVLAVGLAAGPADLGEAKKAGAAAAERWIALVDGGSFDEAWKQSSPTFRSGTTREEWARKMKEVRGPLGAVASRRIQSTRYSETMPGAPDAHYVVVTCSTDFAKKKGVTETVVTVHEGGAWKASGYWIE